VYEICAKRQLTKSFPKSKIKNQKSKPKPKKNGEGGVREREERATWRIEEPTR